MGGNQEKQATRRGWIFAGFGGVLTFALSIYLADRHVEDLAAEERSTRWTIFIAATAIMFVAFVMYVWKKAPDVMTGESTDKGQLWLAGVGIGLSVTIRQFAPDLFIAVHALGAAIGLTLIAAPILLMFVRPWARKRTGGEADLRL